MSTDDQLADEISPAMMVVNTTHKAFEEVVLANEISPATETSNDGQQLVDEMHEWVVEIEGRLENPDISQATKPSMDSNNNNSSNSEELPSIIGNWQCWDDFGDSFFPDTKKWQLVACMRHWVDLDVRSYLEYMQDKVDLAWSYYLGVNEQFRAANNKRFVEHLLANSCFLIFAMVLLSVERDPVGKKDLNVKLEKILDKGNLPKGLTRKTIENIINLLFEDPKRVQCYMLTMDYQIPYFVLEAVYTKLSNIGKLLDIPIYKIALSCFPKYWKVHTSNDGGGTVPLCRFKHLLHIFHWSLVPNGKYLVDTSRITKCIGHFHIPSATNLKLSQTVFVMDESGSIDVSYSDGILSRVMKLTPWHFLEYNTKIYESLLRFEQVFGAYCGFSFTAYITCMACLLKTEDDVRVLRTNGIIPFTSFDDKDVLCCVQEKLKTLILKELKTPNELLILEEKVVTHYQRSAYRVYGDFKRRYCSNPWITISVIGGFLIFVLAFIQTIYTAFGYYKKC